MSTTVSNVINEGKYQVEEKELQMYRGLKEKEQEFLHLLYNKFNRAEDFQPVELSFEELRQDLGITAENHSYFKSLVSDMIKLNTTFVRGRSFKTYSIFSMFEYDAENRKVVVKFNEDLLDYLYCDRDIKLIKKWSEYKKRKRTLVKSDIAEIQKKHKGNYTVTNHLDITLLKSAYAIELYQKLSQFKNYGKKVEYSMNELRELLSIPKSYTPSMIKTRVIEQSKKQINSKTGISIDYEIVGTLRKQIVIFTVEEKSESDNNRIKRRTERENKSVKG